MIGSALAADALPLLLGLGGAGVLLFGIAAWLGRWSLWLAGYALVLAAVVAACVASP